MDESGVRLISFKVGDESFVLDIMAVRQIVPYTGTTPIPNSPAVLEGVMVLRNEVIPVVDLRRHLFPSLAPNAFESLVLIVTTRSGVVGLRVDAVTRIIRVSLEAILPPPPIVRGLAGELFIGVVPHKDEVHLLLDVDAVLTVEEQHGVMTAVRG